jgi:DNA polymerase-3 subunit delta'
MRYDPLQAFYESAKNPASAYIVTARGVEDAILAADAFCLRLFCDTHTGCGHCPGCRKFREGNTVDYFTLGREEPVLMEAVRVIPGFLSVSSYEGGYRCVHIKNAQNLSPQVQNFLLKSIEEPPEGAVFVLSLDNRERLMPTVRSRCLEVRIPPRPKKELAGLLKGSVPDERIGFGVEWSNGSYAEAVKIAKDEELMQIRDKAESVCMRLATKRNPSFFTMEKDMLSAGKRFHDMLYAMALLFRDAALQKFGVEQPMNPDKSTAVKRIAQGFTTDKLRCIIDIILRTWEKKQESPWLRDDLLAKGVLFDILEVKAW